MGNEFPVLFFSSLCALVFVGHAYFIIHLKVIGGRLFRFAKLAIWSALPGPIRIWIFLTAITEGRKITKVNVTRAVTHAVKCVIRESNPGLLDWKEGHLVTKPPMEITLETTTLSKVDNYCLRF